MEENMRQEDRKKVSRNKRIQEMSKKNLEYNEPVILWEQRVMAKLNHEILVREESRRKKKDRNYKVRVKIGKKNRHLFE